MKSSILFLLELYVIALLAGCGSAPVTNTATANAPANANVGGTSTGANEAPAGISAPGQTASVDPNAPPAGNVDPGANTKRPITDGPGPPPGVSGRPAPENSSMITSMGKNGEFIITRVFTNDTQLQKVETTVTDPNHKVTKVYLKDGKVIPITGVNAVAMDMLQNLTIESILQLAGVKRPAAPAPRPTPVGQDPLKKPPH
jgi:hypothetical protein